MSTNPNLPKSYKPADTFSKLTKCVLLAGGISGAATFAAQAITVDGTLDGAYGSPLATQTINTGFGDSTIGDGSSSGGSELDAAYGLVSGGNLYLFFSGNLEQNFNHLNVFIADGRSGQNTLSGLTGSLAPMNGSVFSPGFSATYALDINGGNGANGTLFTDQYNLVGTPSTSFVGGVALTGGIGNGNFSGLQIGLNNVNAAGVNGNSGTAANQAAADAVTTGLELAIPLSLLGNPSGPIKVLADINGGGNGFLSNQLLPGLPVGTGDLGNGGVLNLGSMPNEFFTVPNAVPEPSTLALYGLSGLAMLFGFVRRK
jgi:hypothetical protein